MTIRLEELLPDAEAFLALEPEELAGAVLEHLNSLSEDDKGHLNRSNFARKHTVQSYPPDYQDRLAQALMEAWVWLEREGLLAPRPEATGHWVFITRRGQRLKDRVTVEAYRRGNLLPREHLHPFIAEKAWATFLRGDYDVAVLQAYREVEIAVRRAGGYPDDLFGVALMRKAFHPENGPLSDMLLEKGEREATSALFSGAIGLYKNPASHRQVTLQPFEAVALIVFASHLLGVVEARESGNEQSG